MTHPDSFGARSTLAVGGTTYDVFRLGALQSRYDVARLPYTLRILLENLLRREDGDTVTRDDVEAVATWDAAAEPSSEISFAPARVLLQDFTGVPAVVDLAAMRDAMASFGGDPSLIDPLIPAELVIDHSVQVDDFASRLAIRRNAELEFQRNRERYAFLRWGRRRSTRSRWCRPTPASATRSTSSSSRASSRRGTAGRSPTRSSAPTPTRR